MTAVLFCSAAAFADETPGRSQDCQYRTECTFTDWHDPWRTADTARQLVFLSLLYVDMRQTLEDLDNPNHREANRILGDHPSRGRVQGYTAAVALLHTAGAWVMPKEARGPFQYVSIIIEGRTVYQNYKLGIRVGTNF